MNCLFDANMPPSLAQALRTLGKQVMHVAEVGALGRGAPDQQVIEYAATHQQVVVTRDLSMASLPWFRADVVRLAAGVIFLRDGPRNRSLDLWGLTKLVVKAWDEMDRQSAARGMPFVLLVKPKGSVVNYT